MTDKGVEFEAINYVEEPLSAVNLKRLLRQAGLSPQDALRTKEAAYRAHVAGRNLSDDGLIQIMARYPELLQRPIVVLNGRAALARPVENLSKLGIK